MHSYFHYIFVHINMMIIYIILAYLSVFVLAVIFLPVEVLAISLAGCAVGFLIRPEVPLLGQLPFSVVITGGEVLNGIGRLALPYARESLEYIITGGIIGCVLGYFFKAIYRNK